MPGEQLLPRLQYITRLWRWRRGRGSLWLMSTSWIAPAVTAGVGLLGASTAYYVNGPRRKRLMDEISLWKTLTEAADPRADAIKHLVDSDINRYIAARGGRHALKPAPVPIYGNGHKAARAARYGRRMQVKRMVKRAGVYLIMKAADLFAVVTVVGFVWIALALIGAPSWGFWVAPVPIVAGLWLFVLIQERVGRTNPIEPAPQARSEQGG